MKKKILSFVCALACITSFCVGAIASDNIKEIAAAINYNIKMKVDNVEWNPTEADGSAVRPITYNGRTYLPVRALGEKLGVAIDWDEATQTVLIGEKEWTPITVAEVDGFYAHYTVDPDELYVGDGVCASGIVMTDDSLYEKINLANNWSVMKCTLYSDSDLTLTIRDVDTKQVYKTIALKANTKTPVEFNIVGAKRLQLLHENVGLLAQNKVILGDIYFK